MKHAQTLILFFLLALSNQLKAGEKITLSQLKGNWKMTDVKVVRNNKQQDVNASNCYLCDLYRAKLGLVFTEDGKVNYSNYSNPNPVSYSIRGDILIFSAEGEEVQFNVSVKDDVLTLTRISPEVVETYTLTK